MLSKFYPYSYEKSVFAIDYIKLYTMGYRGLIFDIYNTLVHHGDDSNEDVERLFSYLDQIGFKSILLSNNSESRIQRFNKKLSLPYIYEADKPNPDGFLRAVTLLGEDNNHIICVGDQIFSDILGANRARLKSILVEYIKHPSQTKIGLKRSLEKVILGLYKRNKKYFNRLGDISKSEEN